MIQSTAKTMTKKLPIKTHQGRVCLFGQGPPVPYQKLSPQKDQSYTIECYPNFKIQKDKIDLKESLPSGLIAIGKVLLKIRHRLPSDELIFSQLNDSKVSRSVGQILVIFVQKFDPKLPELDPIVVASQGTCFITKLHESTPPQVVSVFHVLNLRDIDSYDIIPIANFSEANYCNCLEDIKSEFEDEKLFNEYTSQEDRAECFLRKLKETNKNACLIPLEINRNFLKVRRDFINQALENKTSTENFLLDPQFKIKPSPAVDLALFDFNPQLITDRPPLVIGDMNEKDQDFVLIMYASPEGLTLETKIEYAEIFKGNNELEKVMNNVPLGKFIRRSKSASYGQIYFTGNQKPKTMEIMENMEPNPIVLCYASTSQGASGGPLLNRKGEVIAVNFASYYDNETEEELEMSQQEISDNQFDVKVELEDKKYFKTCKNCNLALSMRHPVFRKYLEEVNVLKIQEENFLKNNEDIMNPQPTGLTGNILEEAPINQGSNIQQDSLNDNQDIMNPQSSGLTDNILKRSSGKQELDNTLAQSVFPSETRKNPNLESHEDEPDKQKKVCKRGS